MADHLERRIAAILAADVAGFSRLTGIDEEGTVARLRALRKEIVDPAIAAHQGRIVKTTGDGLLAEFASVVGAVRAARDVQRAVLDRETTRPVKERIAFRIGIHLGDVIVESDGDLMGDGVNIAARLEAMAEPGSLCLSEDAFRQVRDKIVGEFVDLGEQLFKNIARPVRVYRYGSASDGPTMRPGTRVSARPAIAVLPFTNMSGDAEQEYFADGISEDIITELSRLRWFHVIARNSCFAYKGKSPDIRLAARELNARYVLEGSVRKGGNRVRITAQLIDADSGSHIWAERYDRDLTDIFAVQDEITESIVNAIEPELLKIEVNLVARRDPASLDAWDACIRGYWHFNRSTRDENAQARQFFQRAVSLDPNYAIAWCWLARTHIWDAVLSWSESRVITVVEAERCAREALRIDGDNPEALGALAGSLMLTFQLDQADALATDVIRLNPGSPMGYWVKAWVMTWAGSYEGALVSIRRAFEIGPREPLRWNYYSCISLCEFMLGRFEAGLTAAERALQLNPKATGTLMLRPACLVELGRLEEAHEALASTLRSQPWRGTAAGLRVVVPLKKRDDLERLVAALVKAGLPEA